MPLCHCCVTGSQSVCLLVCAHTSCLLTATTRCWGFCFFPAAARCHSCVKETQLLGCVVPSAQKSSQTCAAWSCIGVLHVRLQRMFRARRWQYSLLLQGCVALLQHPYLAPVFCVLMHQLLVMCAVQHSTLSVAGLVTRFQMFGRAGSHATNLTTSLLRVTCLSCSGNRRSVA